MSEQHLEEACRVRLDFAVGLDEDPLEEELVVDPLDAVRCGSAGLTGDALLLTFEQVDRDRALVVSLHQLVTLPVQLVALSAEVVEFRLRGLSGRRKLLREKLFDGLAQLRVERHVVVALLYALLDVLDQNRLEVAARAVSLSAEAGEIRVEFAGLGLGH